MSIVGQGAISFNGRQLTEVPGLSILGHNFRYAPERKLDIHALAQENKAVMAQALYSTRPLSVRCYITRSTETQLQTSLDLLNAILQPQEKVLIDDFNSRQYTATLSQMIITEDLVRSVFVDLLFTSSDPYSYDLTFSTITSGSGITNQTSTHNITLGGSAEDQLLKITITINSLTDSDNDALSITNSTNGQFIEIDRDWAASDVLIIDGFEKSVQVNGEDVEYTGLIPVWLVGTNTLVYRDEFSARNFNLTVQHKRRYL